MDFLKSQLTRLQAQVAALSASQKMLAAALVVIMLMTLMWSSKYASQAEMEDVLAKDFGPDELTMVTSVLDGNHIPRKVNGTRVQVPADRKPEAISAITFAQILPHDAGGAFEDIINRMSSPIDAGSKTEIIQNHAKEVSLAQIIRYFPKVRSAMVTIDPTMKRGFGNEGISPSATVSIQLKPGEKFDKRLVEAAADVVSGGVAAIERKKIKVIIDGASHVVNDTDDGGGFAGGSLIERLREAETYYSQIVQNHFSYIEGAQVHVTVVINDEKIEIDETAYDPKKTVKAESSIKTHTEENNSTSHSAVDPGVTANTGAQVPGSAAPAGDKQVSTGEDNVTTMENKIGTKTTHTEIRPGKPSIRGASVTLPRSYFARIYQRNYQTDKEPPDGVLMPFIDKQLPSIRSQVRRCIDVPSDDVIVVDTYTDLMPMAGDASAQAVGGVSMLVTGHVKEIALGALALISLFMVSMMVRRSGPATAAAEGVIDTGIAGAVAGGAVRAGKLAKPGEDATEVAEGVTSLDGVELDSETVRGQQMLEQVSTMVKENPDAAANLVKRWMNRA